MSEDRAKYDSQSAIIEKPNRLINASYSMPLSAMRLEMLAFTKLRLGHYLKEGRVSVKITAKEYMIHFNINQKNIYKTMKNSAEKMLETKVLFEDYEDKVKILDKVDYNNGDVILHYNLVFLKRCIISKHEV